MNQTIEIDQYTSVEVYGNGYTTLKIKNLREFDFTLILDDDLAEEIMERLCKKLKGFYVEDKIAEMEDEIDDLKATIKNLEELLAEERLDGMVF